MQARSKLPNNMPIVWKEWKGGIPRIRFCINSCDLLEDAVQSRAKRAHREQKKYACTAGQSDRGHPTTLKRGYRQWHWEQAPPAETTTALIPTTPISSNSTHRANPKKRLRRQSEGNDAAFPMNDGAGVQEDEQIQIDVSACNTPAYGDAGFSFEIKTNMTEYINLLEAKSSLLQSQALEMNNL